MNKGRGEQVINLGKVKLTLALEYDRICKVEHETGVGVIAHAGRFGHLMSNPGLVGLASSPVTFEHMVQCLVILSGGQYNEEMMGKLCLEVGLVEVAGVLASFFSDAIAGAPMEKPKAGKEVGPKMEPSL